MVPPVGQLLTTLSQNRQGPKWSFGAGKGDGTPAGARVRPHTPGPGAYAGNSNNTKSRTPSWGFGTSGREMSRSGSAPGPGQYAPKASQKAAAPFYGFGSSVRAGVGGFNGVTPGPGSYAPNYTATRQDAPKYSTTPRRDGGSAVKQHQSSATPGPGSYASGNRRNGGSPEWGFGTSGRGRNGNSGTPGPGSYQSRELIGGGPKYTMRNRAEENGIVVGGLDSTPGPGAFGGQYTQFGY